MRRRTIAVGILILLLGGLGLKRAVQPNVLDIKEDSDFLVKKKIKKNRNPASLPPKKSQLIEMKPQGPQYVISDRTQGLDISPEIDKSLEFESASAPVFNWSGGTQRTRRSPSSSTESNKSPTKTTNSKQIESSPFYSAPQPSPSTPYIDKELKDPDEFSGFKDPKIPVCSSNITGGSFKEPIEINLTCSTASSIKYCISENHCCDPEQGNVYSGAFQLGQASKSFCLSFAGTSNDGQITSETEEAYFAFDPDFPHLEVTQNKKYVQTTQLETEMIIRSNDFGSPHHTVGVINLKSHAPYQLNLDCASIITNHASFSSPIPLEILPEKSVSNFSPASQMNLFLNGNGLNYGENYLTVYVKSLLYSFPQYSCSNSKIILEDFYYVQTLPLDVLNSNDNGELYGGFMSLSTMNEVDSIYRVRQLNLEVLYIRA